MSRKIRKLTPSVLRKIVLQETLSGKVEPVEKVKALELDADEYGTSASLEKDIDHAKVLKLEERRLKRRIRKIQEMRRRMHVRILKGL
jgi:hypothetical protein